MAKKPRRKPSRGQALNESKSRSQTQGRDAAKRQHPGNQAEGKKTASSFADRQPVPVQKNDQVIVDIIGLGHQGEGVGRYQGFTLFVEGTLPGERALVHVLKVKKQYGYAKLLDLIEHSPHRTKAPCPIFEACGGCQLQHLSYEAQLRHKRQLVVDSLERIGKLRVSSAGTSAFETRVGSDGGV
ncbi:TRAM domain-containing protein, partial [Paenibacillus senegalensis]|uniref:TRAM domain-containing protein n=1 Tax=Paenibacillus senegalensis TaxID=1465766 RepID=UPI001F266098